MPLPVPSLLRSQRPRSRLPRAAACALLLWALTNGMPAPDRARGQRLFQGEEPLAARIAGQDFALPAGASRCGNCHGGAAAQRIAPLLTTVSLTSATSRRGGPPSRYDAASFCRLLRSGVDPAHVIVPRTMPRYELSDADCADLWSHLSRREP
ncbi:c-type cytochrome [Azohydromonas caseinilytica]|uniref:Cytochrome c domain-containing protein n=1 Tax=Azohydromonas caseinilytica TaxID=2728836 RepID=A0A848F8V2_9BURK|nr:c-type cytochrome [Azohydromonas caseinilytica]NML16567.1 hypothetical protein [Azohydromonas caseinilytica]